MAEGHIGRNFDPLVEGPHQSSRLAPNSPSGLDHKSKLCAFLRFGDRIANCRTGKAALGADRETVEVDGLGRLVDAPPEHVQILKVRRLAADETQHDALAPWHQSQRSKASGPRGIVFEEEVIDFDPGKYTFRDCIVSTFAQVAPFVIAMAYVQADDYIARPAGYGEIGGPDIEIERRSGSARCAST